MPNDTVSLRLRDPTMISCNPKGCVGGFMHSFLNADCVMESRKYVHNSHLILMLNALKRIRCLFFALLHDDERRIVRGKRFGCKSSLVIDA